MLQRFEDDEFEDFKLGSSGQRGFPGAREKLLCGLLKSLGDRFQDMDDGVLHATAITDISKWPCKGYHEGRTILIKIVQTIRVFSQNFVFL